MDVRINHKKVIDSPLDTNLPEIYDDDAFQLKQDILNSNPSCFLISGYRGVGKTSFINRLEKVLQLPTNQVVFVKVNIPTYTGYGQFLRKLIRGIFLATSSNSIFNGSENKEVRNSLKKLYIQTFFSVVESLHASHERQIQNEGSWDVDLKKVGKAASSLVAVWVINSNAISSVLNNNYVGKIAHMLAMFGVGIWAAINSWGLKNVATRTRKKSRSVDAKSLYDDEIAEHLLKDILLKLGNTGLKLVFVFDELDKISNASTITTLISDAKPLMLSGHANFILVSGQGLYQRYHSAHTNDDDILASIFSKVIHISLFSTDALIELFESMLIDHGDKNNPVVKDYVSSLILRSNRIPRRFIHLIRQSLCWNKDDNTANVTIDPNDIKFLKTDAKLLNVISDVESDHVKGQFDEAIQDFFTFQLHAWIQRAQMMGRIPFCRKDITSVNKESDSHYSTELQSVLDGLLEELLRKLLQQLLIEKLSNKQNDRDSDTSEYFKWTEIVDVKEHPDVAKAPTVDDSSRIMDILAEADKILTSIYAFLHRHDPFSLDTEQIVTTLINDRVLSNYQLHEYEKFSTLRTSLLNADNNVQSKENRFRATGFIIDIITEYIRYILRRTSGNIIDYNHRQLMGFDAVSLPNTPDSPHLLVEVKYHTTIARDIVITVANQIVRQLEQYLQDNDKCDFKLVVLMFSWRPVKNYDKLHILFYEHLRKKSAFANKVQLHIEEFNAGAIADWLLTDFNLHDIDALYV